MSLRKWMRAGFYAGLLSWPALVGVAAWLCWRPFAARELDLVDLAALTLGVLAGICFAGQVVWQLWQEDRRQQEEGRRQQEAEAWQELREQLAQERPGRRHNGRS